MPFRRIASLFRRYSAAHLEVSLAGPALCDEAGQTVGQIDRYGLRGGRLFAEGWTAADDIRLTHAGARVDHRPALPRRDVVVAYPSLAGRSPGFCVDLPFGGGGQALIGLGLPGQRLVWPLASPSALVIGRARLRLLPAFLRDLASAAPALLHWLVTRDAADRAVVKRQLRLAGPVAPRALQHLLFAADSIAALPPHARAGETSRLIPPALKNHPVTLILPVHNAFDLLPEALDRVARHTDLPWTLILIEDASTDPAVQPYLRHWAARQNAQRAGRVSLIENATNLGFIRSVNAALRVALPRGHDVVLLNSDAFVPAAWASRLMRPFLVHDDVASVTPMSNDAEILTVPVTCRPSPLLAGEADCLDALARRFHPDAGLVDAPTGVGFCMAMGIGWLRRLPMLDESFGRGYGEEVDWCRKIRALGGRHLVAPDLFVEHRGGTSFGSDEKRRLIAANNARISQRHPGFDAEVQAFLRDDPLVTPRLALGIALAAGRVRGRMPVYLAHSLGGGAEDYLAARIATDLGTSGPGAAIVLRIGGTCRWQVELHLPQGITRGATDDFGFVERLLDPVAARDIVYSCGVGDADPSELPDRLIALCRANDRIEVLMHDFLPVSPSYTLLDADGRHDGLPDPDSRDRAHRHFRPDGTSVSIAEWQRAWGRLIGAATTITVFSRDSHRLVLGAYPGSVRRLRLVPHRPLAAIAPCVRRRAGRPVIGILGNIGAQKGASVVAALGRRLARTAVADLVVIGTLDPAFVLPPPAIVHGPYRREDIANLASRYGIDRWLIPSVWPETFSYTTHEALATGLPVWCFDLGAQAEAMREACHRGAPGGVLAFTGGPPDAATVLDALLAAPVPVPSREVPA